MRAAFARNVKEQAAIGSGNGESRFARKRMPQQLDPILEASAFILLMRKNARQHKQDFIDEFQSGASQRQVRAGRRIESAGQNPQRPRLISGSTEKLDHVL